MRRQVTQRVSAVAVLAVVSVLGGCGGGGNDESWVGSFCGSGVRVRQALSNSNNSLRSNLAVPDLQPTDLKASVVTAARSSTTASADALARLRAAGEPSVDEGDEIQSAAVARFVEIDDKVKALQAEAEALPDSSRDAIADALGPYSQQVADLSREVAASFTVLQPFDGYADLEKVSRTPNDTHLPETCGRMRTVS